MSVQSLVDLAKERGGLGPDNLVECLAPLFRQVVAGHAEGLVAPLRGIDALNADDRYRVRFDPGLARPPLLATARVEAVQASGPTAVEVVGRSRLTHDVLDGRAEVRSLDVVHPPVAPDDIDRPVLVSGWQTWEHVVGHHDELTDLASLGLLLAALGLGLDLGLVDDADELARHRGNLFALKPDLHPVIAQLIEQLIAPDRHARLQDLPTALQRLETYRDQPVDFSLDQVAAEARTYRAAVLETLRDRLFDLTRRNRLLYFRPTQQSLNLTEASVPLLLDARNVKPEQLCTWSPRVARKVLRGNGLSLGSVIRWDDAPYAAGTLDGLIAQARRDTSEYGRSSVRLVVAFFRWHDLRSAPDERIASPLLLLPVSLTKRRGVRDSYVLQAADSVAEVNPALRQQLDQLYGIDLPESVDLDDDEAIAGLHRILAGQIAAGEPGVTLTIRERPRIELIHRQARLRFDAHQRRTGRAHTAIGGRTYAYSYRRRDLRPLGLQIFRDRVAAQPSPSSLLLGGSPQRPPAMVETVERETFVLDDGSAGNRYAWEIDLCAVTLAALNYRTMSLVSDYRQLMADDSMRSVAFDQVFSPEPRRLDDFDQPTLPPSERHLVVPADGSQVAAIARARNGESFVIQGPPGTGKSQTITNLIADYVSRGRRVLFVCQKRAALDVVHARLRSRGLDELTCLIHDSQADKKEFVAGLRESYESWLETGDDVERAELRRERLIAGIEGDLAEMRRYEAVLDVPVVVIGPPDEGAPSLRAQIARLLELSGHRWGDQLAPEQARWLPSPADWELARPAVAAVTAVLAGGFSGNVLGALAPEVLRQPRPAAAVSARAASVSETLAAVVARLADPELSVVSASRVVSFAHDAQPLTERGLGGVLRRGREVSRRLDGEVSAYRKAVRAAEDAAAAAAGWSAPLPSAEAAREALVVARKQETALLRFLSGDWRRAKALVASRYSGPLNESGALELLVAAQAAATETEHLRSGFEQTWGFADPSELAALVSAARKETDPRVLPVRDALAAADTDAAAELGERLTEAGPLVAALQSSLAELVSDVGDLPLPALGSLLESLAAPETAAGVRAVARPLLELHEHPVVMRALRRLEATPEQIEYAICATSLAEACADDPAFAGFDGDRLAALVGRIQRGLPKLQQAEAELVVSRVRSAFLTEARHAQRGVSGMSTADRARKQVWSAGRRILEHEFGKVQRYKSIREMSSGDSGAVVAALRPVWLMSPASVSDTLPLDPGLFDVVIYDEASQIPVEEAVPAMHRAGQVIVVGDRMQLPPTQYFSTRAPAADDAAEPDDEPDDEVGVVLDGDSFLAQSAVRLPSTMLSWHYRSRFEALIAFSNAMFYGGRLAAVPDRAPASGPRPEIVVAGAAPDGAAPALREAAAPGVDALLGRSVSFHRTPGSVYQRRVNPGEAAYVAELVREFLGRDTGLTLGIVAFSQPQQGEIERALEELARTDDIFARRYEDELNRKDGEQAVGLFVKNLENVQGDERDVMIMSVCYAPGPTGRMLMNFGPINTHGGEKRLNVIVSRARQHMAVVSSIEPGAITNTYNDGAATLRRFLAYAAAVSRGDAAGASAVLTGPGSVPAARRAQPSSAQSSSGSSASASPVTGSPASGSPASVLLASGSPASGGDSVVDQIAAGLRARGLVVEENLGQSAFRCDLALRAPDSPDHQVAVLLDTPERIEAQPLTERMTSHPAVLAATGWTVVHVLTRDWLETPTHVLDTLTAAVFPAEES